MNGFIEEKKLNIGRRKRLRKEGRQKNQQKNKRNLRYFLFQKRSKIRA